MNLTKREKILLGFLGTIILVSVYIVFLFLPLFKAYNSNSAELIAQKDLHVSMVETSKRFGTNDKALNEAKNEADKKLERMLPTQENDKLYDYLLYIAENAGMGIVKTELVETSIQIVSPELVAEVAATEEEVKTSTTLQDNLFLVNGIELPIKYNPVINDVYLDKRAVNMSVQGTTEQLAACLEGIINEGKTMKTIGLSYSTEEKYYTITVAVYSTKGME